MSEGLELDECRTFLICTETQEVGGKSESCLIKMPEGSKANFECFFKWTVESSCQATH